MPLWRDESREEEKGGSNGDDDCRGQPEQDEHNISCA